MKFLQHSLLAIASFLMIASQTHADFLEDALVQMAGAKARLGVLKEKAQNKEEKLKRYGENLQKKPLYFGVVGRWFDNTEKMVPQLEQLVDSVTGDIANVQSLYNGNKEAFSIGKKVSDPSAIYSKKALDDMLAFRDEIVIASQKAVEIKDSEIPRATAPNAKALLEQAEKVLPTLDQATQEIIAKLQKINELAAQYSEDFTMTKEMFGMTI